MAVPVAPPLAGPVEPAPAFAFPPAFAPPDADEGRGKGKGKGMMMAAAVVVVLLLAAAAVLLWLPRGKGPRRGKDTGDGKDTGGDGGSGSSSSNSKAKKAVWQARPRSGDRVQELNGDEAAAVLGGGAEVRAAVLLVHTPHCGHCVALKPIFIAAANASADVHWGMVDGSKAPALLAAHQIRGVPAVFGVRADGKVVKYSGARTQDALLAFATQLRDNAAA